MKEIRVLRSLGAEWPRYAEGQVVEAEDEFSDKLVRLGLARLIKAIPPPPTILAVEEVEEKPEKPRKAAKPGVDKPKD